MFKNRVGVAFWAFVIFNILWWVAYMVGLFYLGKALIEYLNRH